MAAEWTHRSLSPPPLLFTVLTGVCLRHCSFVFLFMVFKKKTKKQQLLLRTIRQAYFQDSSVAPLSYQLNSNGEFTENKYLFYLFLDYDFLITTGKENMLD